MSHQGHFDHAESERVNECGSSQFLFRLSSPSCTGQAITCNDNNVCTADSCASASGCVFAPVAGSCDDGNACTDSDTCSAGKCAGTAKNCDDGIACTTDTCSGGTCSHPNSSAGTSCGTNLTCNGLGSCTCGDGTCESGEGCCVADCGKCGPPWVWAATELAHTYGAAGGGGVHGHQRELPGRGGAEPLACDRAAASRRAS